MLRTVFVYRYVAVVFTGLLLRHMQRSAFYNVLICEEKSMLS